MLRKVVAKCSRLSVFLAGCIVMLLFLLIILPDESAKAAAYTPQGASFDTSFFYLPESVHERLSAYTAAGRSAYIRARWTFDLVFPLAYGFFCLTAIAFGGVRLRMPERLLHLLTLLPAAAVLFDLVENSVVTALMIRYPQESTVLAWAASAGTLLKWVFVISAFTLALILPTAAGLRLAVDRFMKKP